MSDETPSQVGPYEVIREVGRGGMGVVYLARDPRLDRLVAIKALPEHLAGEPDRLSRFEREARIVGSLDHPGIATVHALEEHAGRKLLVMEYVEGETLAARLQRGRMPLDEALAVAIRIAEALEAAHENGVTHRDLKPGNVMTTSDGRVKVLDFGLARQAEAAASTAGASPDSPTVTSPAVVPSPTIPGAIMGTAEYMSPEQARGKPVDARSDIFSFGCVLYEMLTGAQPFSGETVSDSIGAVLHKDPEFARLPAGTPASVERVLRRCLERDRAHRLQHIGDARIELEDAAAGQGPHAASPGSRRRMRRRRVAIGATVIVALLAVPAALWWKGDGRLVYLIDTTAPLGVYDEITRAQGGTNADDLTDVLGPLPLSLVKEAVSPEWRREHQVVRQRPALIVIHRSAFAHQPGIADLEARARAEAQAEDVGLESPYALGWSRLVAFLGYAGLSSPRTRFIVYSRGFTDPTEAEEWIGEVETRFPQLRGRVTTFGVPVDDEGGSSFRDPATAAQVEAAVRALLDID